MSKNFSLQAPVQFSSRAENKAHRDRPFSVFFFFFGFKKLTLIDVGGKPVGEHHRPSTHARRLRTHIRTNQNVMLPASAIGYRRTEQREKENLKRQKLPIHSITPSLFHSRFKTFLFCKSFPPQPSFSSSGLTPRIPQTVYQCF